MKIISFFNTLGITSAILMAVAAPAGAKSGQCPNSAIASDLSVPLPRLANKLASRQPIVIVAIGSSSTAGSGASGPDKSYPAALQRALTKLWPDQQITVINRGINGEEVLQMRQRFARDVFALHADLVVWQLGTNYLMRHEGVERFDTVIAAGIDELRAHGLDVVLMDPQYAPKVLADPDAEPMVSLISAVAHNRHAGLFRRFEVMSNWVRGEDMSFSDILAADGLHMNDWSYDCIAQNLAGALNRSAKSSLVGIAN